MDVDTDAAAVLNSVARDKTAPFLIRTFVKIGGFHRLTLFEDGTLPTTDEHQLFTWKDATLREVLTTLRTTSPHVAEFKHPLARFSFKAVYADGTSSNKGRGLFTTRDLGMVYSRDILGEPGALDSTAPRLRPENDDPNPDAAAELSQREKEERTLDELRFVPGDYLLVSVVLPKSATAPQELTIKGSGANAATAGPPNGWRTGATGPNAPPGSARNLPLSAGRGGGHWRGDSGPTAGRGRGGGGRGGRDRDLGKDRDRDDTEDRRIPPPRRRDDSPPRGAGGWGSRGGRGGGGGRSRSRSPPRRRGKYD